MLKLSKQSIIGILGTILLHAIAFNIIIIIKINKIRYNDKPQIIIDIQPEPQKEPNIDKIIKSKVTISEDIDYTNYAAKLENLKKLEEKMYKGLEPTDEITEEDKKEALKKIIGDDYNKYLNNNKLNQDEDVIPVKDDLKKDSSQLPLPKTIVKGPSTLVYDLKNRYGIYLYLPVYKCKNGGSVTVNIVVNQSGEVISVKPEAVTSTDECILQSALKAAGISKFNYDKNAPPLQQGKIIYTFMPQ